MDPADPNAPVRSPRRRLVACTLLGLLGIVVVGGAVVATPVRCHLRIRSLTPAGRFAEALDAYDELRAWRGSEDASGLAAICRGLSPENLSRKISRIFRMDNLSCATSIPLALAKGIDDSGGCPASLSDPQNAPPRATGIT